MLDAVSAILDDVIEIRKVICIVGRAVSKVIAVSPAAGARVLRIVKKLNKLFRMILGEGVVMGILANPPPGFVYCGPLEFPKLPYHCVSICPMPQKGEGTLEHWRWRHHVTMGRRNLGVDYAVDVINADVEFLKWLTDIRCPGAVLGLLYWRRINRILLLFESFIEICKALENSVFVSCGKCEPAGLGKDLVSNRTCET